MPSVLSARPSPSAPPSRAATVRRDFLERLARPLLLRLLAPHGTALAAAGFALDALASAAPDDRRPVRALHDVLDDSPDDSPLLPLVEQLAAVAKVATAAGREALIKLDTDRRLHARLGAEDLAATACLDHPELFAAVRVGSAVDAIKGFVLYEAAADREPSFDPGRVLGTAAHLGRWFEEHHRTAHCEIHVKRRGPELHFEVTHGKTPKTQQLIDEGMDIKVVTQVTAERSYVIYYEETRILAVHALEFIKDGLRTSFGHGFAGDAAYFARAETLLDAAPLRDLDAALAPEPAAGVVGVELRELEVTASDGSSAVFSASKVDLRETRQLPRVLAALAEEGARVSLAKVALDLGPGRRKLLVVIKADRNQLDYDRRDAGAERALLGWLTARGVWHGGKRAAVAAPPVVAAAAAEDAPRAGSALDAVSA